MPEIVIYALQGRPIEVKRQLVRDVTDAVCRNYGVEPGAVVITLVDSTRDDKAKGGVLFADMAK